MKTRTITLSSHNTLIFLIFLNPLLSLFLDRVALYRYILEPFVTILLVVELSKNRRQFISSLIILMITALSILYAIGGGADKAKLYLHLFCYLNSIYFFIYMTVDNNRESFYKACVSHRLLLKMVIIIINLVEAFMMISRRGYT